MALYDELRDAKQSAKTHEAICQSLIAENKRFRAALEQIANLKPEIQYRYLRSESIARSALEI